MTQTQEQTYYRASLGLKHEIQDQLAADYQSELVDRLRASGHTLELPGLTVRLAKEFGFCYGVDKAIDMAYEARRKFPDRRLILTTELIHNPRVNEKMVAMGIKFLNGQYASGLTVADIRPDDVVILPAFGVSVPELAHLRTIGCVLIDTTCGSVVHVWKRVEKYARDGFTSLIHGKYFHEETIATVSQASSNGGHFLVVRTKAQAQMVCDVIRGVRAPESLNEELKEGMSAGFDPARHLERIGVANQTTMLASESLEIARMVGEALKDRYGVEHQKEHFRSFDTICSATQDRQDAIGRLLNEGPIDLLIVIGGYNSSNTNHLMEMGLKVCPTYHIDDAREILSATEIRHKPYRAKETVLATNWLPAGPVTIGVTAGASTPNRAISDVLERVLTARGHTIEQALAALAPAAQPSA